MAVDTPRLHVLHVIDGLGLGGAERVLVDLVNQIVADGHEASVCVTRSDVTRAPDLDPRVKLLVLGRTRRVSPSAMARLLWWIHAHRVQLVHAHMRSSSAHLLLLRALRVLTVPVIFHDHYGTIQTDKTIPLWFRIGHRYATRYVGVSDDLGEWARAAGMPERRVAVIANTLDLERISAASPSPIRVELGIAPTTSLGVMVATLRRDKAIEILLEAIAGARHRAEIRILIAGAETDGAYADECRRACTSLGLDRTVTFLGPRTDVPALLRAADFGVLASHTESGPLALAEYAAAGLPIVSTLVGDVGRRLEALGVPGFVPPGDARALGAELDRLIELPAAARRERGALGQALALEHWGIRGAMPRWYEIYRGVSADGKGIGYRRQT